jgi:bacteriorhodopsin
MLAELCVVWFGVLALTSVVWEFEANRRRRRGYLRPTHRVITCGHVQALLCFHTMMCGLARLTYIGIVPEDVKYWEWMVSAPLMVIQACVIADVRPSDVFNCCAQSIVFCVCGVVASRIDILPLKLSVVLFGVYSCLGVMASLIREGLERPGVPTIARTQVIIALMSWPIYTVVWCFGAHGLGFISFEYEQVIEMVLGMTLKAINMHVLVVDSERTVVVDLDALLAKTR